MAVTDRTARSKGQAIETGSAPRDAITPDGGLVREQVVELQRVRILAAMVQSTTEMGAGRISVSDVVARSGVSRRTFYELFSDREDCLVAAFDDVLALARAPVARAYAQKTGWAARLRSGLAALLAFLDSDPGASRLLVVESLAAGPRILERRQGMLAGLVGIVEEGDPQTADSSVDSEGTARPRLTAEGIVGAVFSVIHSRIVQRDPQPLIELLNPLMSIIVTPYQGMAAGRRELLKAIPECATHPQAVTAINDPLLGLDMRLTYRTLRVLMALGATPGASNRQVGQAAEMADQGQISKLLGRLSRLGLIQNTIGAPAQGGPNAWVLTPRGQDLTQIVQERIPATP